MGSKSAKAPDYKGAAEAQGASSLANTQYQTEANRINQYTPWGSSTFNQGGEDGAPGWSQTTQLNPMDQQILDQDRGISLGRSGIAGALMPGLYQQMMGGGSQGAPAWAGTPDAPQYGGLPGQGNSNIQVPGSTPTSEQIMQAVGGLNPYQQGQQGDTSQFADFRPASVNQSEYADFMPGQGTDIQGSVDDMGYDPRFAQANYDRNMSLMQPGRDQAAVQREASLRNQGLRPGTEAYDSQMRTFQDQQGEELNRLSQDSILRGAQEQQNQFGRNLAGGQFYNQAAGQQFGQGMQLGQQAASQRGQQHDENMGLAQQMANQRAQQFGEQNQMYGQSMGLADQMSQQRGQQFGELQALQQMLGGQDQAAFDRQMQLGQWQDQQRQQQFQEQMGFGGQAFDQNMQQQQAQNQLRQAYRGEQQQDQGWNLNMINALLSGGQVNMPQFANFNPAGKADTTNYMGAAQNQGTWDLQQQQNAMAPWQALGQIGGGLAGSFMGR